MKASKVTLPPSTHAPSPSTASKVAGSHASRTFTIGAADAEAATTADVSPTAMAAPTALRIDMPVSLPWSHPAPLGPPGLRARAADGSMPAVLALALRQREGE